MRVLNVGSARPAHDFAVQDKLCREAHAEACEVGGNVCKPAASIAAGEIQMNPRNVSGNEPIQKSRRENVIAFAVERALQNVGNR